MNILDLIRQLFGIKDVQSAPLLNPLAENQPTPVPTPTPTPTPMPEAHRHQDWDYWKRQNPKGYEALLSGTKIAEEEFGFPRNMNMDLSGIETSGTQFLDQLSGGPGQGYHQWEPTTLEEIAWDGFDPYSATDSARLVAKIATENQGLGRWGKREGTWGSMDNLNRLLKDRMTTYYSDEELEPYWKY